MQNLGTTSNSNWNIMLGAIERSQVKTGEKEKPQERNIENPLHRFL